MFQRLKGFNLDNFLDGKIAEEQAKQGKQSPTPSASPTAARRPAGSAAQRRGSARAGAANARNASRTRTQDDGDASGIPVKGPDPEDFAIGDDASDISRVATPLPVKEGSDGPVLEQTEAVDQGNAVKREDDTSQEKSVTPAVEGGLSEDVRKKLARLETLTTRYQDLLRNYRTAHARVTSIEPFEATLREHTPLTSITDPGALVEFLNQRALQSDMVMQELKRVTAENRDIDKERNELKVKLAATESKVEEALSEVATLKAKNSESANHLQAMSTNAAADPLGADAVNDVELTAKQSSAPQGQAEDETFFSYETELPRLEAENKQNREELEEQKQYIDELSTENATLHRGLDTCKLDLSAAENKISIKEREIKSLQSKLAEAQRAIPTDGVQDKSAKDLEREKRMKEIQQNIITQLKDEVQEAKDAKRVAEGRANELNFEIKKLESEANASREIITRLRGRESAAESMRKQLAEAERERDEARRQVESKKGHEAAVASLRSQLKRTEHDRDAAYQMIIDCGKCAIPQPPVEKPAESLVEEESVTTLLSRKGSETTMHTEVSTQPTEVSVSPSDSTVPSVTDGKKGKKKKKSKAKKQETAETAEAISMPLSTAEAKTAQYSIEELIADPEKSEQVLRQADNETRTRLLAEFLHSSVKRVAASRDQESEDLTSLLEHHERVIEQRERTIREKDAKIEALEEVMHTKEIVVEESMRRLREREGEYESLREAHDDLQDSLTELGSEATNAKYELKETRALRDRLQEDLDSLQAEHDAQRKVLKQAKTEVEELRKRNDAITASIEEAKADSDSASIEQLRAAEEKLRTAEAATFALQTAKDACEKQLADLQAEQSTSIAAADERYASLNAELDSSKAKQSALEQDLAAANSLAQSRFRDLSNLRDHLNSVQPELKRLREENGDVKKFKSEMEQSVASITKLESKEAQLRAELTSQKSLLSEKSKELTGLREKLKKSDERSSALEDTYERTRRDLEQNEKTRDEATEMRDKLQTDLARTQEALKTTNTNLEELEKKINKFRTEAMEARDELQVKSAQQASAQSMLDSMQDQARELATQMRETRERNESLEEEVADAHRLLTERGREGETMRRLLADVEARADGRVREMRERMELAIEERERAEAEANGVGRRRARETEELKSQLRDAERELARAAAAKQDGERREREASAREEELRRSVGRAQEEAAEVRAAMSRLRDELDAGELASRENERDRQEMRRALEERESRLEKLQTSSKAMAEELRTLQSAAVIARARSGVASAASARSSTDSSRAAMSPVRRTSNGAVAGKEGASSAADAVYLKNVLLQFVEQKDKKHQMQLVPVLAMLLHFDKHDEQKWMAAISAK